MVRTRRAIVSAVLAVIAAPTCATAATLTVPGDSATIQGCIDLAISGVDECVIASGTYNECINFNGKAITLRSADGPDVTTIDGTALSCSVVQCVNGEGNDTVLEGFTITAGIAQVANAGGGMSIVASSPTVRNCVFTLNIGNDNGGGMGVTAGSNPLIANCRFIDNSVSDGGGMFISQSSPTITNCLFANHTLTVGVVNQGGAILIGGGNPTIRNCTFADNVVDTNGGGIFSSVGSDPSLRDCIFSGNADAGGTDESAQIFGPATVTYSCIQGCATFCSNPADQNIGDDPLFVPGPLVPPFGDWYLSQIASGDGADSPCVDAGSGSAPAFFMAGTTRTDQVDDTGLVDMGYHYNATLIGPPIPAVSEWGLVAMALVLLVVATVVFRRARCVTLGGVRDPQ